MTYHLLNIDTNLITGVKGDAESAYRQGNVNLTLANIGAAPNTAIIGISRSGTTFTATRANGGTFTFTQQDNNTTYSAGQGLALSGTQFYVENVGNNTSDTWVPVWVSGRLYHREIPATLNAAYWRSTTSSLWTSSANGRTCYYYQKGNICQFVCEGAQVRSDTTIGEIPSGYRPAARCNIYNCNSSYQTDMAAIGSTITSWSTVKNTDLYLAGTWAIG